MRATKLELAGIEFGDIYARFGPAIYARCRQMLGDRAAAEDATQEVFLRIHQRLEQIQGIREALAWLYRTATNHCLNELRNGRRRRTFLDEPPDWLGRTFEDQVLDQDLVVRLLRHIPEELVLPAWLYHVDGLEQGKIAEICGISRRTVLYRLERFTEQARELLERRPHG